MKRLAFAVLSVVVLAQGTLCAQEIAPKASMGLSGWVIFSDPGNISLRDFAAHAASVDRAYFDWYHVGPDGLPAPNPEATEQLKAYARTAAQQGQCQAWMMVTNWDNGFNTSFDRARVQKFLTDDALKAQHIQTLVEFAKRDQVSGIQIHYQNLEPADKRRFAYFVSDLSNACKKNGLLLGIVIYGNYQVLGFTPWPLSQDLKALGESVVEMVNMPAQQRSPGDTPGYLEDVPYTDQVVRNTESQVPNTKVEVETTVVGYDWGGGPGQALTWDQFQALAQKANATPGRDMEISKELTFSYAPNHEVWFPDAKSTEFMADIAKRYRSYGLAIWYFGGEGADFWSTFEKVKATPQETAMTGLEKEGAVLSNPTAINIYTDKARGHYFYASDNDLNDREKVIESTIAPSEAQGRHWVDIKLKGSTYSEGGMTLGRVADFRPFLQSGALQFYIRGLKGGETLNLGFVTAPRMANNENYEMQGGNLHLSEYVNVTTNWQLVTIPLMDFPQTANVLEAAIGQLVTSPFRWHLVQTLFFRIDPGPDPFVEFQVCNIRVVPSYDPATVHKK